MRRAIEWASLALAHIFRYVSSGTGLLIGKMICFFAIFEDMVMAFSRQGGRGLFIILEKVALYKCQLVIL